MDKSGIALTILVYYQLFYIANLEDYPILHYYYILPISIIFIIYYLNLNFINNFINLISNIKTEMSYF